MKLYNSSLLTSLLTLLGAVIRRLLPSMLRPFASRHGPQRNPDRAMLMLRPAVTRRHSARIATFSHLDPPVVETELLRRESHIAHPINSMVRWPWYPLVRPDLALPIGDVEHKAMPRGTPCGSE